MTGGPEEHHVVRTQVLRGARRLILTLVLGFGALIAAATPASAHPLGNFTVNRYARVEISSGVVRVYYVLDEAELPAFQDRDAVAADRVGFATQRAGEILGNVHLTVDGTALLLRVVSDELSQPPGQGGLTTLRLTILAEATLPAGSSGTQHHGVISDSNEPDRIGWREIVVTSRGDGQVTGSSAPSHDLSDELRHYPGNLLQAPLNLRSASFGFVPGSQEAAALPFGTAAKAVTRYGGQFTSLITRQHLDPLVLAGMLLVAFAFGAFHALAPGHGKTVMAAYLVGTRGRPKDALLLGAVVSFMHTASVLVLGVALFQLSRNVAPDRVYPWLKFVSGLTIAGFGGALLRSRRRALRPRTLEAPRAAPVPAVAVPVLATVAAAQVTDASHDDVEHSHHHDEAHDHDHDHEHPHDHHHGPGGHTHELPEGVAPLSRRGLVVLATAGGLFPSPSALIVLIAAFTLGRVVLGLALIAAFSIGLAATLTGVGLALVYGRGIVERRGVVRTLRYLPIGSAAAILLLGVYFAVDGARGIH